MILAATYLYACANQPLVFNPIVFLVLLAVDFVMVDELSPSVIIKNVSERGED